MRYTCDSPTHVKGPFIEEDFVEENDVRVRNSQQSFPRRFANFAPFFDCDYGERYFIFVCNRHWTCLVVFEDLAKLLPRVAFLTDQFAAILKSIVGRILLRRRIYCKRKSWSLHTEAGTLKDCYLEKTTIYRANWSLYWTLDKEQKNGSF